MFEIPAQDLVEADKILQQLVGSYLAQIYIGIDNVQLNFCVSGTSAYAVVTTSSDIAAAPRGADWVPADQAEGFALLRPLMPGSLTRLEVDTSGLLTVELDSGGFICRPHEHYESWQASGFHRELIVCTPGGGLAVWGPS